jgi:GNAT superfamily N-acetyltransferase/predicted enzyme related to lactoylglutathione lyase
VNLNQVTLPAREVAPVAEFYQRLGLRLIVDALPRYVRLECPDGDGTLSVELTEQEIGGAGPVVYLECEDLDATVARLEAAGITFDSPATDQPWLWREARLRDPAGNPLCLYHAGTNRRYPPWRVRPAAMPAFEVVVTSEPTPEQVAYLEDRIYEFNSGATGIADGSWLGIFVRDDTGRLIAGICGSAWGECVELRQVWVDAAWRRQGLGTRLLGVAEQEARRRGCRQIILTTFTFQAPGFYARHGYEVVAQVDDHPRGHGNLLMRKRLGLPD